MRRTPPDFEPPREPPKPILRQRGSFHRAASKLCLGCNLIFRASNVVDDDAQRSFRVEGGVDALRCRAVPPVGEPFEVRADLGAFAFPDRVAQRHQNIQLIFRILFDLLRCGFHFTPVQEKQPVELFVDRTENLSSNAFGRRRVFDLRLRRPADFFFRQLWPSRCDLLRGAFTYAARLIRTVAVVPAFAGGVFTKMQTNWPATGIRSVD